MTIADGDMITLNEFVDLYRLKSLGSSDIMNSFLGIGSLVSLSTFLRPFVIGSLDIFLCQAMVGRLCPTTFGGTSLGCCAGGRPLVLVCSPLCFFFLLFCLC